MEDKLKAAIDKAEAETIEPALEDCGVGEAALDREIPELQELEIDSTDTSLIWEPRETGVKRGRRNVKLTIEHQRKFLLALANNCNISEAAKAADVNRTTIYMFKKRFPAFDEAMKFAREIGLERLQDQVLDWALNGYEEEETERDGDDNIVRTKVTKKILPNAAIKTLQAKHPDWKPQKEVKVSGELKGLLRVPMSIDGDEDKFEEMVSDTGGE